MKHDWIKEVEWSSILTNEMRELAEIVGIDKAIEVLEKCRKQQVYFSERPLMDLKRAYIMKHRNSIPKDLARLLNVSERYVYMVLKDMADSRQLSMFDQSDAG